MMPLRTPIRTREQIKKGTFVPPLPGSLVVCAGSIAKSNRFGIDFELFKTLFANDSEWKDTLEQKLSDYFGSNRNTPLPAYIKIADAAGLRGGVATVPNKTTGAMLDHASTSTLEEQYKAAIKGAINDAQKLKCPLYIQPLGLKSGWEPTEVARLFIEVLHEEDPKGEVDITMPMHNGHALGSPERKLMNEINRLISITVEIPDAGTPLDDTPSKLTECEASENESHPPKQDYGQRAVYTHSDGKQEVVEIKKVHDENEGGGFTIFIPSLDRERSTVVDKLNFDHPDVINEMAKPAPAPSDWTTNRTLEILKSLFIANRKSQREGESFRLFRRSGFSNSDFALMSLESIVAHAQKGSGYFYSGNRSLSILVDMKVLNEDKTLHADFLRDYPDFSTDTDSENYVKP